MRGRRNIRCIAVGSHRLNRGQSRSQRSYRRSRAGKGAILSSSAVYSTTNGATGSSQRTSSSVAGSNRSWSFIFRRDGASRCRRKAKAVNGASCRLVKRRNTSGSGSSKGVGAITIRVGVVRPVDGAVEAIRVVGVVGLALAHMAGLRIRVVQLGSTLHLHVSLGAVAVGG